MSYNSKRNIASVIAGVIVIVAYIIYALGEHSPAPKDLKSWAIAILVFIGIGVGAVIIIQILFHLVFAIGIAFEQRERGDEGVERIIKSSMTEDEREKAVSLKSSKVGYICSGVGFVVALTALAFEMTSVAALHILFGTFAVGSIMEGIVSVYYYEKGV